MSTPQSNAQIVLGTASGGSGTPRYVQVKTGSSTGVPVKLGSGNVKLTGNTMPLKIGAANLQGKITTNSVQKVGQVATNVPLKLGAGNVKIGTSNVLVKTAGGVPIQAGVNMQGKVATGVPVKLGAGNLPVIGSSGGAIQIASGAITGQQMKTPVYKIVTAKSSEQATTATTAVTGAAGGATVLRQAGGNAGIPVIIKKSPGAGAQASAAPQYVTLVKTSTGMTVATVPKMAMVQNRPAAPASAPGATIVKLVSANAVGGNKIITLPSNVLQLSKAGVGGKQTIVITKSASQSAQGGPPQ